MVAFRNQLLLPWEGPLPSSLVSLDLHSNPLRGPLPASLISLPSLVNITLDNCNLSGTLPAVPLPRSLRSLSLSGNNISGSVPWAAWDVPDSLQQLQLFNNHLTGPLSAALPAAASLQYLELSSNRLTGPLPAALPASLLSLGLDDNALSGHLPFPLLEHLPPNMLSFGVALNRLSGTLPRQLVMPANSTVFTFDVSSNRLSGTLPQQLVLPPSPRGLTLRLSNNGFSGSVPSTWNGTGCILSLDGNQLSGTLPPDSLLPTFPLVNLTLNRLTGEQGCGELDCAVTCWLFPSLSVSRCAPAPLTVGTLPAWKPLTWQGYTTMDVMPQQQGAGFCGQASRTAALSHCGLWDWFGQRLAVLPIQHTRSCVPLPAGASGVRIPPGLEWPAPCGLLQRRP